MEDLGGETFEAYKAFGKKFVLGGLSKVGWDTRAEDGHSEKLLRSTVIALLDTFAWDDADVAAEVPYCVTVYYIVYCVSRHCSFVRMCNV
jgi:hypothetical protein